MTPVARKLLIFAIQFLPLFLVFVVVYLAVLPAYAPAAVWSANFVTERLEPSTEIVIRGDGRWQGFVFTPWRGRRPMKTWNEMLPHLIFLGLAVLPPLLLATPAPFATRFRLLAVALPALFLVQVGAIVGLTRGTVCSQQTSGAFYCLWLLRTVSSSGQLFAVALWLLLTWRHWLTRDPAGPDSV